MRLPMVLPLWLKVHKYMQLLMKTDSMKLKALNTEIIL